MWEHKILKFALGFLQVKDCKRNVAILYINQIKVVVSTLIWRVSILPKGLERYFKIFQVTQK